MFTKRVLRLTLLVLIAVVLQQSLVPGSISPKTPRTTARWEVSSPSGNYIGGVIKATLYITSQPGVSLDWSQLPDTGDVLELEPKLIDDGPLGHFYTFPATVPGGELEIVSRRISQSGQGGWIVTRIDYEFMYLLPIDLSSTPPGVKHLPGITRLSQEYRQLLGSGKIEWRRLEIYAEKADFYLTPRVDENSQPIFRFFELTPATGYWPAVKLAGYGLIALAFCLLAWRGVGFVAARRRRPEKTAVGFPEVNKLYLVWCENPDQQIFIEALKLYRRGVWGRPQAATWITTTFVLYSGVNLSLELMKTVFARIVKEVSDERTV